MHHRREGYRWREMMCGERDQGVDELREWISIRDRRQ